MSFSRRLRILSQDDKSLKNARVIPGREPIDHTRALLAAIVESSDDAIVSKTLDGVITSWNEAACRMFGYSADEMVGQSILRLIPPELQHQESMILARLRAGQKIDHFETQRVAKNGHILEVSITVSPVKDSSGRIIGASKIVRDISERKRMERFLIQSEKLAATGRMAAAVAHEINNPLESVMNLIFLARVNSREGRDVQEYLHTAESELERVSHIARQTLGFYRETAALVELHLHDLMDDVLRLYRGKLRANNIAVDCRYGDHRHITVSRGEFLQIFSNIVTNSIDAMPHGGVLHIEISDAARDDKAGIQVIVKDDGTGIRSEDLEKVFEPFFTTKGNLGTGIGLWVVRELVEKRQGQIALTSSTDIAHKGTTVCIFVPSEMRP